MLFGLTSLIISAAAVLTNMQILINLIPEELEIKVPPIAHNNMKIIDPSIDFVKDIPELLILEIMLIIISLIPISLKE